MLSTRSVRRNICTLMKKLSAKLVNIAERKSSEKVRVARGCVAIYVGEERKRYQVPVSYLSLPKFRQLIKLSHEDADLDVKIEGPITLACTTHTFDQLLNIAEKTALD